MSCTSRGLIYLLEPILIAIVVILLVALFLPEAETEQNYRLVQLHAQDLVAVAQKTGVWECGGLEELVEGLNPSYSWCFRIDGVRECGVGCGGICATRGWIGPESVKKIEVCLDN